MRTCIHDWSSETEYETKECNCGNDPDCPDCHGSGSYSVPVRTIYTCRKCNATSVDE